MAGTFPLTHSHLPVLDFWLPADPSDASNLMGRAGFALLTVDVEDVKINYPSIWELMEDLRDMGESNAVLGR
jgi:NADH dehydrogenase [ubiquinone] 1 alpha subcomplex assembly factor 5